MSVSAAVLAGTRLLFPTRPSAPDTDKANSRRWFSYAIAAAIITPLLGAAIFSYVSYRDSATAATQRLHRTVEIAQEHAKRVMETNLVVGEEVNYMLAGRSADELRRDEVRIHRRLRAITAKLPQVQSIFVWGPTGKPLAVDWYHPAPQRLDVSDRDYFQWARDGGTGWHVSGVLHSRTTQEPFFSITTPRLHEGKFAGAISVSIRPHYFRDFYAHLAAEEPGLAIVLVRADGAVISRFPDAQKTPDRLAPNSTLLRQMQAGEQQGSFSGVSTLDGESRELAFRQIGEYPLYVAASKRHSALLSAWATRTAWIFGTAMLFAGTLASLLWLAQQRTRERVLTLERLRRESEQRLRAEETLRHAQKLEALGQLTGGVAHDFNNLLMVVNNNTFLLRQRHPGLEKDRHLESIGKAVDTGARLTRQLLAFSRRQAWNPVTLQLQDVLPGMRDLLTVSLGSAVRLDIVVDPALPCVHVDPAEFELAMINLAINARDAMPGGGRFTIRGMAIVREGTSYVEVCCADTGKGIPVELRDRVFDPFFTTKPRGQGTGLGLSQLYGFCTQSQGLVEIHDTEGGGATICLLLPPSADGTTAIVPAEERAERRLVARILLVEDNLEVADATQQVLAQAGATVTHIASAVAALELIEKDATFDLVLSDVVMPGAMDGISLAEELRRRHPELPVVLVTGYTAEINRAQLAGMTVLQKPVKPEALLRLLSRPSVPA